MRYRNIEQSTHIASGRPYFLVYFWRGTSTAGQPDRIEEFIVDPTLPVTRVKANAQGQFQRAAGTWVDRPDVIENKADWTWETVTLPMSARVKQAIERYWVDAELNGYPQDHRTPGVGARDLSDPHGVLARPDVRAMKNVVIQSVGPTDIVRRSR